MAARIVASRVYVRSGQRREVRSTSRLGWARFQAWPGMFILIVEDHDSLAANIGEYLVQQGDVPDYASLGGTGLALCREHDYDAVVLDLNLPDADGVEVCTRLRQQSQQPPPILMLTARDTFDERITGLESGAADYLTKPFSLRELHLRLQAIVGRRNATDAINVGDIEMYPRQRRVQRRGESLQLSRISFDILKLLVQAFPNVVTRSEIESAIWRNEPPESEAALRRHIHRLRQALATPDAPERIDTIHGIGYRLSTHA